MLQDYHMTRVTFGVSTSSFAANTVFPRNLATARFYFKAQFGAATIRGQRLLISTRTCTNSFNNNYLYRDFQVRCPRPLECDSTHAQK